MKFFSRMICIGFEPNMTGADSRRALGFLVLPWRWRFWQKGRSVLEVERQMNILLGSKHSVTIDSGRSALYISLKALGIRTGDEVLVQGYTCVVVSNAITRVGASPVYVDIGNDFNMDVNDAIKKVTPKTRAIIIQHTFGTPARMDELMSFAQKHQLRVIEDCAHSLGAIYKSTLTGTIGDIGMFSFGSDKVVSSVRGGAIVTNDDDLAQKIRLLRDELPETPRRVILTHLLHYPLFTIGKLSYRYGVGKVLLYLSKKLHLISWVIEPVEKQGKPVQTYPTRFPNVLADMVLLQLARLKETNERRRAIAQQYWDVLKENGSSSYSPWVQQESIFLRFPLLVPDPKAYHTAALKQGIMLGDWYATVIAPVGSNTVAAQYVLGSCPNAERMAKQSINLPTNPNMTENDVRRVVQCITTIV